MGQELIGMWLEVPADPWPPDHYTLLGLPQGDEDRARVERHVQERLEQVRRFQLAHPEQATEAMNRLAQAFVCLTNPETKRAYDAALAGGSAAVAVVSDSTAAQPDLAVVAETPPLLLDWRATPPPARIVPAPEDTPLPRVDETGTLQDAATAEATPALPAEGDDAPHPLPRGLTTKRAVLERVLLTRQMLAAWRAVGKYLRRTTRPLTKPAEATELLEQMGRIQTLLGAFGGPLGQAGQPGYLVVALARQPLLVPTLQTLLPSQRAALARDWQNGLTLLTAHLGSLREELRALRGRGGLARGARAVLLTLRDRPGWVLFALGLVALNLVPAFRARLGEQVIFLLGLLAFRLFLWWDGREAVRRSRAAARRPASRPPSRAPRTVA